MISFREFLDAPDLIDVLITQDGENFQLLREGKWIDGRFEKNIRIDQPTSGAGQTHAHIYGRNRKTGELGIVNLDGTGSHGTKNLRLHRDDADELRNRGFDIPSSRLIEWARVETAPSLLFG